ncbi:diacylglycerol kinase family protein [Peribacillus huizhouensis]|uniref:diacylglycerol kinase family protein n=1 Tax=Peribacillus huizhouensis TaxID=1501239 RepID=UPI0028A8D368|nr:diacylglycerol kinase family protein [Peribacillus huizhouensis]
MQKKDHAQQLTENILKKSAERTYIISVGGDGTLHEVINGAASFSNALITCVPAGSGNDFARGIQKRR